MTEEEARKKWCPMVRFHQGYDGDVYTNTLFEDEKNESTVTKCIASDCMMWRRTIEKYERENSHIEHKQTGYCGLGGKP